MAKFFVIEGFVAHILNKMKNEVKIGFVVLASVLAGAVGSWFFLGRSPAVEDAPDLGREQRFSKTVRSGSVKKITEISVSRRGGKKSVRIVEAEANKPDVVKDAEIDDEESLSDIQKSVLREIQAALDADDIRALRKALSRFTASAKDGGLGGYANVPRVLRAAAVQALGWFGGKATVDLVDFMVDADEEISSDAFDQFESALQDSGMSDFERSAIVKTTAKAITDPDRVDVLLDTLMDMRNSVKGKTAIAMLTEGSEQIKAAMQDQLELYFDDGVTTVDDIKKWMAENPDDSDDDDFYGGDAD